MADDKIFNVLFLCTGNSARSILAEAILAREGMGRFKVIQRGQQAGRSRSTRTPSPSCAGSTMTYPGTAPRAGPSSPGDGAPRMDFVFTVCDNAADEVCPVWPGQPMSAHWGIPDPAAATGTRSEVADAFADAYRMLTNRISIFVNLPIASLDKLALRERLDDIGKIGLTAARRPARASDVLP